METMTQEDKELLLKDVCERLPHGVKVAFFNEDLTYHSEPKTLTGIECINNLNYSRLEDEDGNTTIVEFVKPYLFPLSSMTEEQKRELLTLTGYEARCEESCGFDSWGFYVNIVGEYKYEDNQESIILYPDDIGIDWYNKNHFDYRGLIEKGLALDATGLNIYKS